MKKIFFYTLVLFATALQSQVMPYEDLFFWSQADLFKNKIQKIEAYEFTMPIDFVVNPETIIYGELLTEEVYDSLGRVIEKSNHYPYSDVEIKTRSIRYLGGQVGEFTLTTKGKIERHEVYNWQIGQLMKWTVKSIEDSIEHNYSKEIVRDKNHFAKLEIVKSGKKIISTDTILHEINDEMHIVVRKNQKTKITSDSIITYHKFNGDTIFKKAIYNKGILTYKEVHWKIGDELTQRIEEYEEGIFHKVYYRISEKDRVFFEKQIHVVPVFNFDKIYTYSLTGVPIKKEVYRNGDTPETVVYYKITNN